MTSSLGDKLGRIRGEVNPESIQNVGKNLKEQLNAGPHHEIHPLASLDANLARTIAFCNQCQARGTGKGKSKADTSRQQERAIEYAGEALKDARNYEINRFPNESAFEGMICIVNAVAPYFKRLGKYSNGKELGKLLREFAEYAEKQDDPEAELSTKAPLVTKIISITSANPDLAVYFLKEKGLSDLLEIVEGLDKDKITDGLRKKANELKKYEGGRVRKIYNNLQLFIEGCSLQAGYCRNCKSHTSSLEHSKAELGIIRAERDKSNKYICSGGAWFLDVLAGFGENVTPEEFNMGKALIAELSERDY